MLKDLFIEDIKKIDKDKIRIFYRKIKSKNQFIESQEFIIRKIKMMIK